MSRGHTSGLDMTPPLLLLEHPVKEEEAEEEEEEEGEREGRGGG